MLWQESDQKVHVKLVVQCVTPGDHFLKGQYRNDPFSWVPAYFLLERCQAKPITNQVNSFSGDVKFRAGRFCHFSVLS